MHVCAITQACLGTHMEVKGQLVRVGPSVLILGIRLKLSVLAGVFTCWAISMAQKVFYLIFFVVPTIKWEAATIPSTKSCFRSLYIDLLESPAKVIISLENQWNILTLRLLAVTQSRSAMVKGSGVGAELRCWCRQTTCERGWHLLHTGAGAS